MEQVIHIAYFLTAFLFIIGLKRMSSPVTARSGIIWAGWAMLLAVVVTFFWPGLHNYSLMIIAVVVGSIIANHNSNDHQRIVVKSWPKEGQNNGKEHGPAGPNNSTASRHRRAHSFEPYDKQEGGKKISDVNDLFHLTLFFCPTWGFFLFKHLQHSFRYGVTTRCINSPQQHTDKTNGLFERSLCMT